MLGIFLLSFFPLFSCHSYSVYKFRQLQCDCVLLNVASIKKATTTMGRLAAGLNAPSLELAVLSFGALQLPEVATHMLLTTLKSAKCSKALFKLLRILKTVDSKPCWKHQWKQKFT